MPRRCQKQLDLNKNPKKNSFNIRSLLTPLKPTEPFNPNHISNWFLYPSRVDRLKSSKFVNIDNHYHNDKVKQVSIWELTLWGTIIRWGGKTVTMCNKLSLMKIISHGKILFNMTNLLIQNEIWDIEARSDNGRRRWMGFRMILVHRKMNWRKRDTKLTRCLVLKS